MSGIDGTSPRLGSRTPREEEADRARVQCFVHEDCTQRVDVRVFDSVVTRRAIAIRGDDCACGARLCATCTPENETECLECHRSRGCDHYGYSCGE